MGVPDFEVVLVFFKAEIQATSFARIFGLDFAFLSDYSAVVTVAWTK